MRTTLLFLMAISMATATVTLTNVGYMNLGNCQTGNTNLFDEGAYKAAFDPSTRLLYVTGDKCVRVVSIENPSQPTVLNTRLFTNANDGRLVDIAMCGGNVAVLFESVFGLTEGHLYMCERYNPLSNPPFYCERYDRITVGESPKSMTFTKDCSKLLVANEARAGMLNGVFTDPDGTVSIINMSRIATNDPCTRKLSFSHFNNGYAGYLQQGIRWPYRGDHNNGIVTQFSQDIEPEEIAISDNGEWAYVTLPENNAMAVINLLNEEWDDIYPLGTKSWSNLGLDASDFDTGSSMNNYEVKGMYQPTGAIFVRASTVSYVVTANTGAPKMYTSDQQGFTFTDAVRTQDALNSGLVDQSELSSNLAYDMASTNRLGRVYISNHDGKSDINNLIKDVHLFGGRDLGFYNTNTNTFTYTTGDDLERKAAEFYIEVFNGDCSNASVTPAAEMDSRSTYMGPEPNVLASGEYNSVPIVTAATRNGLIYVYSFSSNTPLFESVHRLGDPFVAWGQSQGSTAAGDGLISDMGYIAQNVLGGNPFLYVISRGTGSVSIKEIANV
ncbi:mesenchyme-specific cell surface glycoprotein-like [Pecten maximus]|uniref:mesenchyme-specific cell surface glycoprotein-like n=1 Tax=Pecten maximus TaxID=6579 RepID=UPI0014586C6B|nr:mesenchyme-specific cell surface glycoprotein-like [Pecten maximus]